MRAIRLCRLGEQGIGVAKAREPLEVPCVGHAMGRLLLSVLFGSLVTINAAGAGHGQTPGRAELRWNWAEHGERVYRLVVVTEHRAGGGRDADLVARWHHEMVVRRVVESVDDQGIARVSERVDAIKLSVDHQALGRGTFDSATGERRGDALLTSAFESMVGAQRSFSVDAEGRVRSADGASWLTAGVAPQLGGVLGFGQGTVPGAGNTNAVGWVQSALALVPGKAVARGDRWRTRLSFATPIGDAVVPLTHTLERVTAERAHIATRGEIGEGAGLGTAPQGSGAIEFQRAELSIETEFDLQRGLVLSREAVIETVWRLPSLGLSHDTMPADQSITQHASWVLVDENAARGLEQTRRRGGPARMRRELLQGR